MPGRHGFHHVNSLFPITPNIILLDIGLKTIIKSLKQSNEQQKSIQIYGSEVENIIIRYVVRQQDKPGIVEIHNLRTKIQNLGNYKRASRS